MFWKLEGVDFDVPHWLDSLGNSYRRSNLWLLDSLGKIKFERTVLASRNHSSFGLGQPRKWPYRRLVIIVCLKMTHVCGFAHVICSYMQTVMKWYVYVMIRECFVVFDELICLWYEILKYDMWKTCSGYFMWLLWYMIWYMHDVDCYVWKHEYVMIWYMCAMNHMIWLTWKMTN